MVEPVRYEVDLPEPLHPGAWITVSGGTLDQPLDLKLRIVGGRRPTITAIRVDNDSTEITGRWLRQLRIQEIADAVLAEVQARIKSSQEERQRAEENYLFGVGEHRAEAMTADEHEALENALSWQRTEAQIETHYLQQWLEQLRQDATESRLEDAPRGRGAKAPADDDYAHFARIYLQERVSDPRRAVSRTAERTHMVRQTAYRWIAACQERGLLPKELDR